MQYSNSLQGWGVRGPKELLAEKHARPGCLEQQNKWYSAGVQTKMWHRHSWAHTNGKNSEKVRRHTSVWKHSKSYIYECSALWEGGPKPLLSVGHVWWHLHRENGMGRGRKRNSPVETHDRYTSARWPRVQPWWGVILQHSPGGTWWEGHMMRRALPLCGLPLQTHKPRLITRKTSDRPAEGQFVHHCPALLQTTGVIQTKKVWETLLAKSSWRRRDGYSSCEVRRGPGAAGGHEVKPEETWINVNNNVLIWYANVSLIVTIVLKDVSDRTLWMWGI